jgi:hypothetical protein
VRRLPGIGSHQQAGCDPREACVTRKNFFSLGGGLWLDVHGSNFVNDNSGVMWNNALQLTAFVDSTHLRYQVPASAVAQPGGGDSNTLPLVVKLLYRLYLPIVIR